MNLNGLRILNTRPQGQEAVLSEAIERAGGVAIKVPALAIEAVNTSWLSQLPDLTTVSQAIFISPNAAHYFFPVLRERQLPWPEKIHIITVGKATAAALNQWSVRVDQIPPIADSEHVLQLEGLRQVQQQTILLIKGEGGRLEIANTLRARGAEVIPLDVYRRTLPVIKHSYLTSLWHDDAVDIILFTSQQALQHLFLLFGEDARPWLCSKPCLVISERLAQTAQAFGIKTVIVSDYDHILNTLEHYTRKEHP